MYNMTELQSIGLVLGTSFQLANYLRNIPHLFLKMKPILDVGLQCPSDTVHRVFLHLMCGQISIARETNYIT